MTAIRWFLGKIILMIEFIFTSRGRIFSASEQSYIDREMSSLVLYEFMSCPFCVKVRMHSAKLGLTLERRDVKRNGQWMKELMEGGQQHQVPCLRIQEGADSYRWLYESNAINQYLSDRFGQPGLDQALQQ